MAKARTGGEGSSRSGVALKRTARHRGDIILATGRMWAVHAPPLPGATTRSRPQEEPNCHAENQNESDQGDHVCCHGRQHSTSRTNRPNRVVDPGPAALAAGSPATVPIFLVAPLAPRSMLGYIRPTKRKRA